MAFDLSTVARNVAKPPRITIHGDPGIGKTTFGACAPNPIFLRTEDGLGTLDVPTFPVATTFGDVMSAIVSLYSEPHDFQTLVIDSIDWLEPLVWQHVCEFFPDKGGGTKRLASIEDAGYGKGYVEAIGYWRQLLDGITALRDARGMTVVMIAHSAKVRVEDPTVEAYDRFDLKLHKKAAAIVEEYSDVILYATQHVALVEEGKGFDARKRAISNGNRVMHTQGKPAFLAKNRYGLPPILPLPTPPDSWAPFAEAMAEARKGVAA